LEYRRPHLPITERTIVGMREREEKRGDTCCGLKMQGRWLFILEVELLVVRTKRNLCGVEYFPGYKRG